MACARCGCGAHQTEDIITLNKIWHKCCFTCYRCRQHLNKCSAKIFQGEVFCESCYNCMVQQVENCMFKETQVVTSPSNCNPCRVVSSPSCCNYEKVPKRTCYKETACCKEEPPCYKETSCCKTTPCCKEMTGCCKEMTGCCEEKPCYKGPCYKEPPCYRDRQCCGEVPCFDYCKKYEVCFPAEPKVKCSKTARSCSCIPDRKVEVCRREPHCFTFPMPREVANYYNRVHNMPGRYVSPPNCCSPPKCLDRPCIKVRTISPCGRSPPCRLLCMDQEKCGCPKCCPVKPRPCLPRTRVCCHSPRRCSSPCRRRTCSPCRQRPCYPEPPCCSAPPCRSESPCRTKSPCCSEPPCRSRSPRCFPGCVKVLDCPKSPTCCEPRCDRPQRECSMCCPSKIPKYCPCGNLNPCNCKINQIREICTAICVRCGYKVYAAERILVSSGAYHTSCFSCYCCHKLLDVKSVYENCGEIYCKQCYNSFFGVQYYGYGTQ